MSESSQEFQSRTGASVGIGQRWQHRKNLRLVVIVGFTNDGWTVHYRTADDPKSKRLSVSAIYSFVHAYQRHPCVACGSLLHATSDCVENLRAMS